MTEHCNDCDKEIGEDEWVVNWGSCDECFNRRYEEYLKENPQPPMEDFHIFHK